VRKNKLIQCGTQAVEMGRFFWELVRFGGSSLRKHNINTNSNSSRGPHNKLFTSEGLHAEPLVAS
jgi:hypothetical protein